MGENKISIEVAEGQIQTLLDYYGIEKTDIEIEDGAEAVQTMYNTLTRAISRGVLEISNESGELTVTHRLVNPVDDTTEIVYTDKVGHARIAMDSISSKKAQSRQNQFMATLGDIPAPVIMKLRGFDSTVFSRLSVVFSMV
ncbi:MAG: hypothetical protein KAT93_07475 [Desulfuromonadales bacterium]|nr:hypothetical protein [Desulfuromonadales bacterium]